MNWKKNQCGMSMLSLVVAFGMLGVLSTVVSRLLKTSMSATSRVKQDLDRQACDSDASCRGFTFVSGWNRCFLKSKIARFAILRFVSAAKGGSPQPDFDNTRKDLRRVIHLKTPLACSRACGSEPKCTGWTYLDGYGDCWLKSGVGRLKPKVFYCGTKLH